MNNNQIEIGGVCVSCGCNYLQARLYAKALDFEDEFLGGMYSCCQVVQWSEEQWLAWREAAREDGKTIEEFTQTLESREPEKVFVKVPKRSRGSAAK